MIQLFLRTLAASLLLVMLLACVPAETTYFKASAPGGELGQLRRECSTRENFISFSHPERSTVRVSLGAVGADERHPNAPLSLLLLVAKNGDDTGGLGFASSSLEERRRRLDRYKEPVEVTATSDTAVVVWEKGGRQVVKLKWLPDNRFIVSDHFFQQAITIDGFSGDWLEVRLPAISFEGVVLELPPVRFTQVHEVVFSAINC